MALSGPPLEALLAKALALGIPVKDKIATMALSAPPLDGALLAKALALGIPLVFARLLISYLTSPLKQFPGPFLAKFTDLWRVLDYFRCTQMQSHQELHKKHGAAVRIGPNMISLSDPALLKTVYSTRGEFPKSEFYEVADSMANGQRIENIFSTRSNVLHGRYMKPYSKYFSMPLILSKEHLFDKTVLSLCQQLETRFVRKDDKGKTAPLADWIDYTAWDLDWQLTFSQDLGFLETGADVRNMMDIGRRTSNYFGIVGQMPWLDRVLAKNAYAPKQFATFEDTAVYCYQKMMERISGQDHKSHGDFLDNFLEAKEQHPDVIGDSEVVGFIMVNVVAGADTTSIEQKAITYNILSHPQVLDSLREELDAASLSFPPTYAQTKDLPYLNAVIREGMRMHPVISGILERVVPSTGLHLPDGRVIPPGTKVGINAWVSSRSKAYFGEDADVYRPERWLQYETETGAEYDARLRKMKEADFSFGYGKRACVGRHMATVEMHKITSTLFSRYEIQLDEECKQWTPRWSWFPFIDDINVKLRLRGGVSPLPAV